MAAVYTAAATATGDGRGGRTRSSDGIVDLDLAVPKEMGGPGGEKSNPEQLFAAGYAACFHGAARMVAGKQRADTSGSSVTAEVGIGADGQGGFALEVTLRVNFPAMDTAAAVSVVEAAHQVCPYSNATRNNIPVELVVTTNPA